MSDRNFADRIIALVGIMRNFISNTLFANSVEYLRLSVSTAMINLRLQPEMVDNPNQLPRFRHYAFS